MNFNICTKAYDFIKNDKIIGADMCYFTYESKNAQVFAIFIKNPEFLAKKKAKQKNNSKNIIWKEYRVFLDMFFKKKLRYNLLAFKIWCKY